jgi:hypothetical protein
MRIKHAMTAGLGARAAREHVGRGTAISSVVRDAGDEAAVELRGRLLPTR